MMEESKKEVFKNFKLYAVTDVISTDSEILARVDAAYEGGADIIQLRSKVLMDTELFEIGKGMKVIAEKYQKLFFLNDRVDLAFELEADGVHVGQEDASIESIQKMRAEKKQPIFIGKSTHSFDQAKQAAGENPDYIGVGPIFGTPTKPDYLPVGCELIRQVSSELTIPFVAIGGIDHNNIEQVLEAGASRVAVVRAVFSAEDVYESTRKLCEQIEECRGSRV